MKKSKIPKLLFISLLLLTAATALATQVKMVAFSNGSGNTTGSTSNVKMAVGLGIGGRSDSGSMSNAISFGFWELHNSTYVSAIGIETPVASNHLFRNYPNPFNPSTRISFTLAEESEVMIDLYDIKGRKVDHLLQEVTSAGVHSFTYQPENLASGVYFILMRAGSFRATQRMMLVK